MVGKYIIILFLCFISLSINAQTEKINTNTKDLELIENDTLSTSKSVVFKKEIVNTPLSKKETSLVLSKSKVHSPKLAWIMSAVIPGLGQIYNGQWWKVPILYGGVAGTIYGINWNTARYNEYKDAFGDYLDYLNQKANGVVEPVSSMRWKKVFPDDVSGYDKGQEDWFKNALKNKKDSYKRDRDLTYILMGGIYFLNIIDALVYAHFYDFDISDDLSMRLSPSVDLNPMAGNSVGVFCAIRF